MDLPVWTRASTLAGLLGLALATGIYFLASRPAIAIVFGGLWVAGVARRRLRGQPNVVLLGVGQTSLVILRASFALRAWRVLDAVGCWPRKSIVVHHTDEPFALELGLPDRGPLRLTPLWLTDDALQISSALVEP